jgi:hypothetical protein
MPSRSIKNIWPLMYKRNRSSAFIGVHERLKLFFPSTLLKVE